MLTRTGSLRNMPIFTTRLLRWIGVAAAAGVLVICVACKRGASPSANEYEILNAATIGFVRDWGFPEAAYVKPKTCYLVDHFATISDEHRKALLNGPSPNAVQDLLDKSPTGSVKALRTSCQLIHENDALRLIRLHDERLDAGVLWLSRAGVDSQDRSRAVVVISETRSELAGSTWVIFLTRGTEGTWAVTDRRALSRF
jgi:hypothetical protein